MQKPELSLYPGLLAYVRGLQAEMGAIPAERRAALEQLASFVHKRISAGEPARLVFICTHNSRRSHLAQIWAQTAAYVSGLTGVESYSGGTEATAFNPRVAAALERVGFRAEAQGEGDNPSYLVQFSHDAEPMVCFSKVYDQPPNPTAGFCAVMTCAKADEGCPVVFGAAERITIRYDDPKESDGTPHEQQTYNESCREIARDLLHAFREAGRS